MLQKVPPLTVAQARSYPQNLARFDLGAQIEAETGAEGSALAPFLSGDPASAYSLKNGITTLLISLAKIENVDRISFLNADTNGTFTIATASAKLSSNSPQWHEVRPERLSGGLNAAKLGPAEAKYIRLTFNVRTPGRLSNLGVYSAGAVSDFTMPRPRRIAANNAADPTASIRYNLADLHAKARIIFVSSGNDLKLANNMIDTQPETAYTFAPNDPAPGAIIDLGRSASVDQISILSNPGSPNVTCYALPAIPDNDRGNSMVRINPQMLTTFKAVGTGADDGSGFVALHFQETSGRYVLLTWASSAQTRNLSVAEVAIFGRASNAGLLAANTASARDSSKDETAGDSKDTKDFSKEIPSEGPAEEQASSEGPSPPLPKPPPFVFIPRVTPTSF